MYFFLSYTSLSSKYFGIRIEVNGVIGSFNWKIMLVLYVANVRLQSKTIPMKVRLIIIVLDVYAYIAVSPPDRMSTNIRLRGVSK